ncbi:MAG: SUMF1/EgtB/PvdO family nonheme iron enzyme [Xanthobacteraceae bacterium]
MAETGSGDKLKVFISYSRRDSSDFADELVAGLELAGFAPFLDRHDIAPGEPWEERLGGLIQQADTVVYAISPEAVRSERCQWEVDKTVALSKRLIPVVFKPVPEAEIPEQLRQRQFVRFDSGPGFARPLGQLAEALRQDLDWIREHTRMGELATRWEARGQPASLLLHGEDITAAHIWMEQRKRDAPAIKDVVRAFIQASREAEATQLAKTSATRRRITLMQALLSAALVAVIVGLVGWINQSFIADKWRWTVTRPYAAAMVWPHVLTAMQERALKPGDTFKECAKDCPEMVVVPAGSFTMGAAASESQIPRYKLEIPQHLVTIANPFAVSKYELTFADWSGCVTGGGCNELKLNEPDWRRGSQPVINVDWNDARQYTAWLSRVTGKTYRLLSEAEYEYATRAGTTTAYPWGDDTTLNGSAMANCANCGSKWDKTGPVSVGSFAANKFGLYDMVGNVFEWTEDCHHDNYNGAPADGSAWTADGDCTNRTVRGSSWNIASDFVHSAFRGWDSTDLRSTLTGFRVARTLDTR